MKELETPISPQLKEVLRVGEGSLNKKLFMSDEEFKKLGNPSFEIAEEKLKINEDLKLAYENICELLKKYCDLNEDYYPIIAVWIIGTYFHEHFRSYPYLYLNAMRGSGKTRLVKLIADLARDGEIQMSMTEAVLFRTNGTIGIDEFEGISRKGNENLRELLNACYKKGTKVKRMKQKKNEKGDVEQVVEEFDVYRPIVMANISGMEEVLGDRCIPLILEKSFNPKIIKLQEIWDEEIIFKETKKLLEGCIVCSVEIVSGVYTKWNEYVLNNYISTTTTHYTHTTHHYTKLFKRLNLDDLDGRVVELALPLLLVAIEIGEEVLNHLYTPLIKQLKQKKEDQFAESQDISFIDYVSQELATTWISVSEVTRRFREFMQSNEEWINPKWVGVALKRLKLRKDHKRARGGINVILDIDKAQEKIKRFK